MSLRLRFWSVLMACTLAYALAGSGCGSNKPDSNRLTSSSGGLTSGAGGDGGQGAQGGTTSSAPTSSSPSSSSSAGGMGGMGGGFGGQGGLGGAGGEVVEPFLLYNTHSGFPDSASANDVALDSGTNLLIAGQFLGSMFMGEDANPMAQTSFGQNDAFVVKLGPTGQFLWQRQFGDNDEDAGLGIDMFSNDDMVVVGTYREGINVNLPPAGAQSNLFMLRLTGASGSVVWAKAFGAGSTEDISDVLVDPASQDIFLVGSYTGGLDFSDGVAPLPVAVGADPYIARFDAAGNHLWSRAFVADGSARINGVAVAPNGKVAVVGELSDNLSVGGILLQCAADEKDMFFAVLDGSSGNPLVAIDKGDAFDQSARAVAVTSNNDIIVTADFQGAVVFGVTVHSSPNPQTNNVLLVGLDDDLEHLWSHHFGDGAQQNVRSIAVDNDDAVVITGTNAGSMTFGATTINTNGGNDIFIAKLDATSAGAGAVLWAQGFGGSGNDRGLALATDSNDDILLGGDFTQTIDFGLGPLTAPGTASDAFALLLDAAGP